VTAAARTYLDAEVAPGTVHFGDVRPRVGDQVVLLAVVHARDSVEAADGVHVAVVCNNADTAAPVAHWSNHRPLSRLGVETLGRVETFLSVEASRDEHFIYASTTPTSSPLDGSSMIRPRPEHMADILKATPSPVNDNGNGKCEFI